MTEVLTNPTADRIEVGTVVTDYASDAVILGYTTDGDVELCRDDGTIQAQAVSPALARQYDPARQDHVLRRAVTALDTERRRLRREHAQTLDRIRAAAIEKHEDGGEICQEGLNQFLRTFGMAEYGPRVRVDFTIRGSYEVDTTDDYEARAGAEDHLGVDLTYIDDADTDSLTHKVEVMNVETIGH
jgi:hypothetical protein